MGLPRKIKNMNLHADGVGHLGVVSEFSMPKLAVKLEDWRGGGMLGPLGIDMGLEKIEPEFTLGGLADTALRQFGAATHDAAALRFSGAFQDDSTGAWSAVEAHCRGRYAEIDFGKAKPGDDTEHKYKMACSYYRLVVQGQDWIEVDFLNAVFIVFGQDRYAEMRAIIGS